MSKQVYCNDTKSHMKLRQDKGTLHTPCNDLPLKGVPPCTAFVTCTKVRVYILSYQREVRRGQNAYLAVRGMKAKESANADSFCIVNADNPGNRCQGCRFLLYLYCLVERLVLIVFVDSNHNYSYCSSVSAGLLIIDTSTCSSFSSLRLEIKK